MKKQAIELVDIEDLTEAELDRLHKRYEKLNESKKIADDQTPNKKL